MSDHVIIVVPADPHSVPAKAAQRYAAELVRAAFPDADDITSEVDPLPVVDSLLAATAHVYGLTVVTRNTADVGRTGAPVLDPFS
jgi:predicted nucleic acid-binding protein